MSESHTTPSRPLRIAVAGGTGTIGRPIVDALRADGHEAIVLTRSTGVDIRSGAGLDSALEGVTAVIDAGNVTTTSARESVAYFEQATTNLVAAARRRGVSHLVAVSIVGIDRMPFDYLAGKAAQERIVESGDVPWSIQRATQFHEFAGQVFARAKLGPLHVAPRGRTQPIAVREAAAHVAALAAGAPVGRARDLAGPREERLDEMVRAYARATGHRGWVPSVSLPGGQLKAMRDGLGLPGPDAVLGTQTFAQWLAGEAGVQHP